MIRKLWPIPLILAVSVVASAAQASTANVTACSGDCSLPFIWHPPADQGVILVELVFANRSIPFTWPDTIDGYTVTGVAMFFDGEPLVIHGPAAPDEIQVRLETVPTPPALCDAPAPDVLKWWCENGVAVPVRETFLPVVLGR